MGDLLLPVGERRMSSWRDHQRRTTPSSEPGTDWYCPIGTPVLAPADGRVYGFGSSIVPASGRWVGLEFDNGMSFRAMHFSRLVRTSGRVHRGEVIAYSGASGYGKEDWSRDPSTGGAHVHGTLWPNHNRRFGYDRNGEPYTVDFMEHVGESSSSGGAPAGGEAKPIEGEDMPLNTDDKAWIRLAVQQEIGAAMAVILKAVGEENLSDADKAWMREMNRQELGGALYGGG